MHLDIAYLEDSLILGHGGRCFGFVGGSGRKNPVLQADVDEVFKASGKSKLSKVLSEKCLE